MYCSDEHISDDEIFFGQVTLKEVKRHILHRQTVACINESSDEEDNASVKIIETHSAPDIVSVNDSNPSSPMSKSKSSPDISPNPRTLNWDIKSSDDSFLKIERMVSELCVSHKPKDNEELDSTLEVIDYILNNKPLQSTKEIVTMSPTKEIITLHETSVKEVVMESVNQLESANKFNYTTPSKEVDCINTKDSTPCSPNCTPVKKEETRKPDIDARVTRKLSNDITPYKKENFINTEVTTHTSYCTPVKKEEIRKPDIYATPSSELKTPFKTPGNPVSSKKLLGTPSRKQFQHVMSPVASYINNCPLVPLLKDVRPKRPLPGTSSIPKPVNSNLRTNICNKENVKLPCVAYRSAKETKVIDIPDEHKLPQSHWAKQVMSSIPKAVVMKHDHRENNPNSANKLTGHRQEDSFADLSLHQADLSVCTQKSAFKKPK